MSYENEYWEAQSHINELYADLEGYKAHVSRIAKIALILSDGLVAISEEISVTVNYAEELTLEGIEASKGD